MADKPISQFPAASSVNASDVLAGVQDGVTKKFSFAVILACLQTSLANLFVPVTRKVNNKALSADITLTMDDISNGTTYAKTTAAQVAQIGTNEADIDTIEGKIPSAASPTNQLADKAFVTDSVTQGTAIFRGSFATKAALLAVAWQTSDPNASYYVSNNDYAVVLADETQNNECWRYIYVTGTGWTAQYRINESPMTQAQLDALNSGATAAIISSVADKLDKTGDGKDVTATFSAASTRANISTGEKLSVMFGKIAKWFTDLGTAAFAAISTSTPNMDGTGAAGNTGEVSDAGHTHPTDTSRAERFHASAYTIFGLGTANVYGHLKLSDSTSSTSDTTDGVAATPKAVKSVQDAIPAPSDATPQALGTAAAGSSGDYSRADHVHPSDTSRPKYTAYNLPSAQTKTHTFGGSCQFMIITQRILAVAGDQSNGVYFGYVSDSSASTGRIYTIYTPANYPVTFSLGVKTIDMTVPVSAVRITVIEFPQNT